MTMTTYAHAHVGGRIAAIALSLTVAAAGLGLTTGTPALAAEGNPTEQEAPQDQAPQDQTPEETPQSNEANTEVQGDGSTPGTPGEVSSEGSTDVAAQNVTVSLTVTDDTTDAASLYASLPSTLTRDTLVEQAAWQRAAETCVLSSADTRPDGTSYTTALAASDGSATLTAEYIGGSLDEVKGQIPADATGGVGIACVIDAAGAQHWVVLVSSSATQPVSTTEVGSNAAHAYTIALPSADVADVPTTHEAVSVEAGKTAQLALTTTQGAGVTAQPVSPAGWTFASNAPSVASVDATTGLVTGAAEGTATITATNTADGSLTSWSVQVSPATGGSDAQATTQAKANTLVVAEDEDNQQEGQGQGETVTDTIKANLTTENQVQAPQNNGEQNGASQNQTTTQAPQLVDVSEGTVTVLGITSFVLDENGTLCMLDGTTLNPVPLDAAGNPAPAFSLSLKSTSAQINDDQYTSSVAYDADAKKVYLTITAAEGSTVFNAGSSYTFQYSVDTSKYDAKVLEDSKAALNAENNAEEAAAPAQDEQTDIKDANFSFNSNPTYNNGETPTDLNPVVKLKDDTTLTEGTDYTVSLSSNDLGTQTITFSGIGNYTGTHTDHVRIQDAAPAKQTLEAAGFSIQPIADQTFTGSQIQPKVTVSNSDGSVTLAEGQDYTIDSYQSNVNAGTATVHVQATNASGYTGDLTQTFTIAPAQLSSTSIVLYNQYATGEPVTTQAESVKLGNYTLVYGTDYTIDPDGYANNTEVGTATARLVGKGNFTGSVDAKFEVVASGQQGASSNLGTTATLPQTGDLTSYALPIGAGVAGAAAIAGAVALLRRGRRENG